VGAKNSNSNSLQNDVMRPINIWIWFDW